jgi:Fanconi anemia group M protein
MKFMEFDTNSFITLTGKIHPVERTGIYDNVKLIFSTPQLIENDIKTGRLDLSDISCLIVDECHRSVKRYSYPFVAKMYMEKSKYPLILGLTASPGGSYKKIDEICKNLFIEAVEIRSEKDEDVIPYVQKVQREWIYVEFPEEFQKIKLLLEEALKDDLFWLRDHHLLKTLRPSKKLLLALQKKMSSKFVEGGKNYSFFWAIIRLAGAIKIEHGIELLETQGIFSTYEYLKKLEFSKKRTDKRLFKDPRIREAIKKIEKLYDEGVDHPKLEKLTHIVKDEILKKPDVKIIVFANYRSTVDKINSLLKKNNIKSEILIGQATREKKGLTQEKQIETLRRFANNEFNVLIGTSISEEGLSIPNVDTVIFYESVPSEIRKIQRMGRTGRTAPGKVIFLITKKTRDVAYMWSAYHKEKKMRGILYKMKERGVKKTKKKKETLLDWVKR